MEAADTRKALCIPRTASKPEGLNFPLLWRGFPFVKTSLYLGDSWSGSYLHLRDSTLHNKTSPAHQVPPPPSATAPPSCKPRLLLCLAREAPPVTNFWLPASLSLAFLSEFQSIKAGCFFFPLLLICLLSVLSMALDPEPRRLEGKRFF